MRSLPAQRPYWDFGPQVNVPVLEGCGLTMRIRDDIRKAVVFVGFRNPSEPGGFEVVGTGFFMSYDQSGYFVTCRHVAESLGDTGFVFRFNKTGGDSIMFDSPDPVWYFHPDETVDLAVGNFRGGFGKAGLDHVFLDELFTTPPQGHMWDVGIGDECYTVGLYRFLQGTKRNVPILHVGHIALMAGEERIPLRSNSGKIHLCDSHLVEGQGVHGVSGSPVFVRSSVTVSSQPVVDGQFTNVRLPRAEYLLLGVWQSSWFASPDDLLQKDLTEYEKHMGGKVSGISIGKGAVVPLAQLIEILEGSDLKQLRADAKARDASKPTSLASGAAPHDSAENPKHQEDFNRLLDAAAKKPKQDD